MVPEPTPRSRISKMNGMIRGGQHAIARYTAQDVKASNGMYSSGVGSLELRDCCSGVGVGWLDMVDWILGP